MFRESTITKMFQEFENIKKTKNKKNYFSVTKFPHYEIVSSNVLKFFFSPDEEHNFKDTTDY